MYSELFRKLDVKFNFEIIQNPRGLLVVVSKNDNDLYNNCKSHQKGGYLNLAMSKHKTWFYY